MTFPPNLRQDIEDGAMAVGPPGDDRAGHQREATVATARSASHDAAAVREAVQRCVAALPSVQSAFRRAGSVLLKPNLLSDRHGPDRHVNTHPSVVQALAAILISDFGCEVAIGDSCGSQARRSTAQALGVSGMVAVAERVGARIYNVDTEPRHVVPHPAGLILKEVPLPATLGEFDLVVSVAKLKTHMLTYTTGPVKNMLGLVPGSAKKDAHLIAPHPVKFATLLCDLYELVRPGVAFVDGVVGMEGRGPSNGKLRPVGLIGAGDDAVALDSFCAQVMGFDPLRVPLLAQCGERGLGTVAPGDVAVRGEPAGAFAPEHFAKPPTYACRPLARLVPGWLARGAVRSVTTRYAGIRQDRCERCGECARNCPSGAIVLDQDTGRYSVDRGRCICCFCCAEACPYDAIEAAGNWTTRIADWLRGT